jgi:hypothetical protein
MESGVIVRERISNMESEIRVTITADSKPPSPRCYPRNPKLSYLAPSIDCESAPSHLSSIVA